MAEHRPRKRFGQHFLVDRTYIGRIIDAVQPQADNLMVEIGPGLGAITEPLSQRVRHLHAVEIDRDVARELTHRFTAERVTVHQADALDFDFGALGTGLRVVGNLPYNISSPLLFWVATASTGLIDCHFMLQKEVVDRMAAAPGSKAYGRLTVMLQALCTVEPLFDVPPGAFHPPPKVDSAVVRLVPLARERIAVREPGALDRVVRAAFSQRRKTLHNALKNVADDAMLRAAGIDPGARAEDVGVAQYIALANAVG